MKNYIDVEVEGNAMTPSIGAEDIITIDTEAVPRGNGEDIAVLEIGGKYHVCKFTWFGSQMLLIHDNAPISVVNESMVEVVGKVVGVQKSHLAGNKMALA